MIKILISFLVFLVSVSADDSISIREDFAATPPELPITQDHIVNKDLTLELHGDKDKIKKSHHANKKNDPHYVWSGQTKSTWAVSLNLKESISVDNKSISLKWRTKQSGGKTLYVIIQNEAGQWFIYNEGTGTAKDWNESSFNFDKSKWSKFDITTQKKGDSISNLEFKKIKSFGFTDLEHGKGSKVSSRVDWLELRIK